MGTCPHRVTVLPSLMSHFTPCLHWNMHHPQAIPKAMTSYTYHDHAYAYAPSFLGNAVVFQGLTPSL